MEKRLVHDINLIYFHYLYQANYKNVFALVTLILKRGR